jgi:hypothetical protein
MKLDRHLTDLEITQAADGELSAADSVRVRDHLEHCWNCRARRWELETTIKSFLGEHQVADSGIMPVDGPRALLKAKLSQLAGEPSAGISWRGAALAVVSASMLVAAAILIRTLLFETAVEARTTPDPALTPGATLPLTAQDICAAGNVEAARIVPVAIAQQVFASYGIKPKARAYEMDYLITPALGGADSIRNFWPQPYAAPVWNAHIKDALEDHLRDLVCKGELELSQAQEDIARDWVAAYKKYFHSDTPLAQHITFTKDQPWE